jgi:hypothetical protein
VWLVRALPSPDRLTSRPPGCLSVRCPCHAVRVSHLPVSPTTPRSTSARALVDRAAQVGLPGGEAALDFYGNKSGRAWPKCALKGLRIAASSGRYLPVRCGLNSCAYCYRLKCFERAQIVYEDALVVQPHYSLTLTSRAPVWDGAAYREGKAQVLRELRRAYGRVEAVEFIEQTTGLAPRSGGKRRGHGHNLLKHLPAGQVLEIEALVVPIWKRTTGAWHVSVSELKSAGGAAAYLTLNLVHEKHKARQMPTQLPKGTRTMRTTRDYWSVPYAELVERARDHNRRRRLAWKLAAEGVAEEVLDVAVAFAMDEQSGESYRVVRVAETSPLTPLGPRLGRMSDAERSELAASRRRLTRGVER